MAAVSRGYSPPLTLALPALLLIGELAMMGLQFGGPTFRGAAAVMAEPETVTIAPGEFTYRPDGRYLRAEVPVDAPLTTVRMPAVTIMKYQVKLSDYMRCAADGACKAAEPRRTGADDAPVTGVNYDDAISYATWISRATGDHWELPTDREWAYAANESFASDATATASLQGAGYADIWLARYEEETSGRTDVNAVPRTIGSFGINRNGVADMGGNVWEWTSTCYRRIHVDDVGRTIADEPSCGIRILDGRHRAPMSYFIRDARSGGCSVGVPPDNLGFRLVRRNGLVDRVRQALGWGD